MNVCRDIAGAISARLPDVRARNAFGTALVKSAYPNRGGRERVLEVAEIVGTHITGNAHKHYAVGVLKIRVGTIHFGGVLSGPHRKTEAQAEADRLLLDAACREKA